MTQYRLKSIVPMETILMYAYLNSRGIEQPLDVPMYDKSRKAKKPATFLVFLGDQNAYGRVVLLGSPLREVVESLEDVLYSKDGEIFDASKAWRDGEHTGRYELVKETADAHDIIEEGGTSYFNICGHIDRVSKSFKRLHPNLNEGLKPIFNQIREYQRRKQ